MKKIFTTLLSTLTAACCICGVTIAAACREDESTQEGSDGLEYALTEDRQSYYLSGYTDDAPEDIVVASEYNGLPVTAIGEGAFETRSDPYTGLTIVNIRSVTIPSSVKEIWPYAFSANYTVETINLAEGLEVIGTRAFSQCSVKELDIPSTVREIGAWAFFSCDFESITIPEGVTELEEETFYSCSNLTKVNLPDSLRVIGVGAFHQTGITHIDLPAGLTTIERGAFLSSMLQNIELPDDMTTLNEQALNGAYNLEYVVLPAGMREIGDAAFDNTALKTVYYKGTAEQYASIDIGEDNQPLNDATVYYYSAEKPSADGNFWHYNADGEPEIWLN